MAFSRVNESDDDELAAAYYCGNVAPEEVTRWMRERPQDFAGALLVIWERIGHASP